MSLTGGVIAVALFALKPLLRNRLPKAAQYYLWLIVIAAFLVPFSKLVTLPAPIVDNAPVAPISEAVERYMITSNETHYRLQDSEFSSQHQDVPENQARTIMDVLMWLYPLGIAATLMYAVISFTVCARLYRRRNAPSQAGETAVLAELCGNRRAPRLYRNPLAATPMLIGLFHPAIILPDREYSDEQLHAVLLHELTHLRRKDILVKWLSVLACAVHWFNPLVWLTRREIDRACELSCDEAVIRGLDTDGKKTYGDTLIAIAAVPKLGASVTLAMCEEKKNLKERLGAIMKNKKATRLAVTLSVALIVIVGVCAVLLGAGSEANQSESKQNYNSVFDRLDTATIESVHIKIGNDTRIADEPDDIEKYVSALTSIRLTEKADASVYGSLAGGIQRIDSIIFSDSSGMTMMITPMAPYIMVDSVAYIAETEAVNRLDYTAYTIFGYEGVDAAYFGLENTPETPAPIVTVYEYNSDNTGSYPFKPLFNDRFSTEGFVAIPYNSDGWIPLNDTVTVVVTAPVGTVDAEVMYAEAGTEQAGKSFGEARGADPLSESKVVLISDFSALERYPNGFHGHIWAVTTDADGVEHTSEIVNVIYEPIPTGDEKTAIVGIDADNGNKMFLNAEAIDKTIVEHTRSGQTERVGLRDDEAVRTLAGWVGSFKLEHKDFAVGQIPGDSDGGEVWSFDVNGINGLFVYYKGGAEDCYIIYNGEWYKVQNPADPPIS
jgi:beta-lactamase regulating signal transducer with metallopeptidase domain